MKYKIHRHVPAQPTVWPYTDAAYVAPVIPPVEPPIILPPTQTITGVGFAFHERNTTGGDGAQLAQVYTAADYIAAIAVVDPRSVQIMNDITFNGNTGGGTIKHCQSNKTIWSANGRAIQGISTWIEGKSNVKFRNVKIKNVGYDTDGIHIGGGASGIFLDHIEYSGDTDYWNASPLAAEGSVSDFDGAIDANGFTGLTIANSKFSRYDKLFLWLGNTTGARTQVTMYGNYFDNIRQRVPSITDIDLHYFNNYSKTTRGGAQISLLGSSKSLIHGNYFENCSKIISFNKLNPGGTTDARFDTDNTFLNCTKLDPNGNAPTYLTFNTPYVLPVGFIKTAAEAKAWALLNSGATLSL